MSVNRPTTPVGSGSFMPVVTCPTCGQSAHANPCKEGVRTTCCGAVIASRPAPKADELVHLSHEPVVTKKPRRRLRESKSQGRRHS